MQEAVRLVIIGSGIAGCSAAYHLAELGWTDILVIDQGPLYRTGGSTSHAPGGVFQTSPSRMLSDFARYTVELYAGLRIDGLAGITQVGGIELAETAARLEELKRRRGLQQSWGIDGVILSPAECRDRIPILDQRKVLGGLFVPTDGVARPVLAAEAMARRAIEKGVRFQGDVEILGFEKTGGRVSAVLTGEGRIAVETVLCCAGIWGPKIGRLAGVPISLQPLQHQYVKTEPVAELVELAHGAEVEVSIPLLRAQDHSLYFRQHGDSWGIGNYRHAPLPVDAEALLAPGRASRMPSLMAFTPEHFEECHRASINLFPCIEGKGLADSFNGIFSFPPDGMPLIGEYQDLPGFWVAEGVWITHAGGVGRAVAHWMAEGDPGADLREADINRFHPHQTTRDFVLRRGAQQYREIYDIIHPAYQITDPRDLRVTPVNPRQRSLDAHFHESAGWERPQWYGANAALLDRFPVTARTGWAAVEWSPIIGAEHLATRAAAGLFDLSAFTKIEVAGPAALGFLQHLCANDVDKPVGKVVYSAMLTERGGIKCDLTLTRVAPDRFLVLTGASTGMSDIAWLRLRARLAGHDDAVLRISDVTRQYCGLGLWGPQARAILQQVTEDDVSHAAMPYYTAKPITLGAIPALALRISYAGELGWEIYVPAEFGAAAWDRLREAGASHDLTVCGGGALDSLRIEKGYRLWGADIHTDYTPLEAGLAWAVRFAKPDFLGRAALLRQREAGIRRRLCCLTLDEPGAVVLGKEPVLIGGLPVSYVTSTNFGYSVGRQIAYAYLPIDAAEAGQTVEIEYFGVRHPATVGADPLFDPAGQRIKI
ncbi:MAG TPA: FAD-dependent oxidoreductase [Stellaceae bacterium]|nr:FAD-dependent oxidoreductase [Stellaceae bacterium]